MNAGLLAKLFGTDRRWHGPCTVVLDADASIQATGSDSIVNSGTKMYSPRLISGRVAADAVCLIADEGALVLLQTQKIRQATGHDITRQTLVFVSVPHVAAVEIEGLAPLKLLGLSEPSAPPTFVVAEAPPR
jgi:hypothetical protein